MQRPGLLRGANDACCDARHLVTPVEPHAPLRTPDGRYIVVRGRLWRASNPNLAAADRERLVIRLMDARRQLRGDAGAAARAAARAEVQAAKVALGERGPVWWNDGAADFSRKMALNTPYAEWFALTSAAR